MGIARSFFRLAALIPLSVYALGTPYMVLRYGSTILIRDGLLPYEFSGLLLCFFYLMWDAFTALSTQTGRIRTSTPDIHSSRPSVGAANQEPGP